MTILTLGYTYYSMEFATPKPTQLFLNVVLLRNTYHLETIMWYIFLINNNTFYFGLLKINKGIWKIAVIVGACFTFALAVQ